MTAPPTATSSPSLTPLTGEEERLYAELKSALGPRIQVVSLLGRGGMALVFLGRDPQLKRSIAIKVLAPSFAGAENARARFTREAQAAATVTHPNVAGVYDVGELPSGMPYYLMQFVDGPNLGAVIESEGMMSEGRARRVIGEIASALAAAHAKGLVHRDIKPANIIIESESKEAIVVDFGISAALDKDLFKGAGDAGGTLTAIGTYVGTPKYTSPEQAAHDVVSGKSDVYSLGVVAYEVLTGRTPFGDTNPMALLAAHIKDVPAPIKTKRPDLDATFASLVDRCLEKDPAKRPDASEIASFLVPAPEATIEWPPPGLESLRGVGVRFARAFNWFGTFATIFIVALAIQPSRSTPAWSELEKSLTWSFITNIGAAGTDNTKTPDATQVWLFVLLLAYAGATVSFIVFAMRTVRMARSFGHARRQGYPVAVIGAVGLDESDDTGALISRSGPYAMLSAAQQRRVLMARRARIIAPPAGFLLSMVAVLLWLAVANSSNTSPDILSPLTAFVLLSPVVLAALGVLVAKDVEIRMLGRSFWSDAQRVASRKEFIRDWLERVKNRADVPVPASGFVLTAACALVGLAFLFALFVVTQTAIIATRAVSDTRVPAGDDFLLADGWYRYERFFVGWLDSLVPRRPATETPQADTATVRRIAAGVYARFGSTGQLPGADTLMLPPLDRAGFYTGLDFLGAWRAVRRDRVIALSTNPWGETLRRFARGGSVSPPFLYPTSELLRRRNAGHFTLATIDLPGLAASIGRFTLLVDDPSPARRLEARAIAEDVVHAGRRLMRSPLVDEYERGANVALTGVRMLQEYARVTRDPGLVELAGLAAVQGEIVNRRRWGDTRRRNADMLWAATGNLDDMEGLRRTLTDWRLHPFERWHTARALASSWCTNTREILFGVNPTRTAALTLTIPATAPPNSPTHQWIELQRERLNGWMTQPRQQLENEFPVSSKKSWAFDVVRWVGFEDLHARMVHCAARVLD